MTKHTINPDIPLDGVTTQRLPAEEKSNSSRHGKILPLSLTQMRTLVGLYKIQPATSRTVAEAMDVTQTRLLEILNTLVDARLAKTVNIEGTRGRCFLLTDNGDAISHHLHMANLMIKSHLNLSETGKPSG